MPSINDITNLAQKVGVSGAALLILAVGVAWNLPSLAAIFRGILYDFQDFSLQRKKFDHTVKLNYQINSELIRRKEVEIMRSGNLE